MPYHLATSQNSRGAKSENHRLPGRKNRDRELPDPRFLMGWDMGLEPTTPGTTIRCSTN